MANVLLTFIRSQLWRQLLVLCSSICWVGMVTYASLSKELNVLPLKDIFIPGYVLENVHPSGLLMCQKLCTRRSDCCGINLNTINLTCSILSTPCSENELKVESRRGYIYTFLGNSRNQTESNHLQYTKCFKTPGKSSVCLNFTRPRDCEDIPEAKMYNNRIYRIYPNPRENCPIYVQCQRYFDDASDNQWTVIQRRFDGSQNFSKNWDEYKNGFGDTKGEYWIGNQALYELTSTARYQLLVLLTDFGGRDYHALYSQFSVSNESSKFQLTVGGYSGNAGDSLSYHNGMPFSTSDKDNKHGCANEYKAGWWYNKCHNVNLNGRYFAQETYSSQGLDWRGLHAGYYSFKNCTMMIKMKRQN